MIFDEIQEVPRALSGLKYFYENALLWISDCGLVHKIYRITTPNLPLKAYEDGKFKLFLLDVGLLSCMFGISSKTLFDGNDLFKKFKGALTEQYVLQELKIMKDINIIYFTNERNSCEIDFEMDDDENITPIEVNAEVNLMAKSLKSYYEKYKPKIAIRTAITDYKVDNWITNIPLYAINTIKNKK